MEPRQIQIIDTILDSFSDEELIELANEMDRSPIPENANIRQVAFHVAGSYEVKHIYEVAPRLALALADRLSKEIFYNGKVIETKELKP